MTFNIRIVRHKHRDIIISKLYVQQIVIDLPDFLIDYTLDVWIVVIWVQIDSVEGGLVGNQKVELLIKRLNDLPVGWLEIYLFEWNTCHIDVRAIP